MDVKINNSSGIYYIYNLINNKCYIGSTYNFHKRKLQHFNTLKNKTHKNSKLQNAFDKYGEENFEFGIIEYVDLNGLLTSEQKWMDFFNPEYNIIPFADRREFSDSHRENLSKSHLGNKHTEESKIKISKASKGNKYRLGTKLTDEQKLKISKHKIGLRGRKGKDNPLFGRKRPQEDVEKTRNTKKLNGSYEKAAKKMNKPVIQYDINDILIKEWSSIKMASESLGIHRTTIGMVCSKNGINKTAGGYKWEFKINK